MFTFCRKRRSHPGILYLRALRDTSGAVAVEFALIGPVMLFFMLAALVLGTEYNNFVVITNAAQAGAFQLTVSRGATTPWTGTVDAVKAAAPGLTPGQLTISLAVDGTACTSDSSCKTALAAAPGKPASVTVAYPCSLTALQINPLSINIPGCPRTTKSTGRIQ